MATQRAVISFVLSALFCTSAWASPCGGLSSEAKKICLTVLSETADAVPYVPKDRDSRQCSSLDGLTRALCYGLAGDSSRCQGTVPSHASSEKYDICKVFGGFGTKLTRRDSSNISCSAIGIDTAKKYCEAVTEPSDSDCSATHESDKASCRLVAKFFALFWRNTDILTEEAALASEDSEEEESKREEPSDDPSTGTLQACNLARCQATCDSGKPNAATIKGFMSDGDTFSCLVDEGGVDQACLSSKRKSGQNYLAGVCSLKRGWGRPVIEAFVRRGPSFLSCTPGLVGYYERYGYVAFPDFQGVGDLTTIRDADIVVMQHR